MNRPGPRIARETSGSNPVQLDEIHLGEGERRSSQVPDESLPLQIDQGLEGLRDPLGDRLVRITQAELDEVKGAVARLRRRSSRSTNMDVFYSAHGL